jgi:glycine cleavage system H protein
LSEYTYQADKFVFHVRKEIQYSKNEVWVKQEGDLLRVGVTDFAQRRGGDIVFAETQPAGTKVTKGEFLGSYETIKLVQDILSPVEGTIIAINSLLESKPEVINSDPYGEGWIAIIKPANSLKDLITAEEYFEAMKGKVVDELKKIKGL